MTYNGKEILERKQPIIECRCNCYSFFSPEEQTKIFQTFNCLKDHSTQNTYLQGCVQVKPSDRIRRPRQENGKQRKSFTYSVTCERKTIYVCQAAFLGLHGIKKSRLKRKVLNFEAHILDGRGSHANHAKIEAVKNRVRKHIQLFPARESHYSRSQNKHKKYLDASLSVAKMYRAFIEANPDLLYYKIRE